MCVNNMRVQQKHESKRNIEKEISLSPLNHFGNKDSLDKFYEIKISSRLCTIDVQNNFDSQTIHSLPNDPVHRFTGVKKSHLRGRTLPKRIRDMRYHLYIVTH